MSHDAAFFGFPLWLRLTHYINFLFLTLLICSGIQIPSDHPRLYWNKHCTPGSEWIKTIELVDDYRTVGAGLGGYREDFEYYGTGAEI